MTKEELIAENALLRKDLERDKESDEYRRQNLSQMLGAPIEKKSKYYSGIEDDSLRKTYSWPEIYFALGQLISKRDHADFMDEIRRHEIDIADLRKWREEKRDELTHN